MPSNIVTDVQCPKCKGFKSEIMNLDVRRERQPAPPEVIAETITQTHQCLDPVCRNIFQKTRVVPPAH